MKEKFGILLILVFFFYSSMTVVAFQLVDESTSWDMVTAKDLWEDKRVDIKNGSDQDHDDDFVLVKQEDIVDGIACFMATYLLSLKETKVYSSNSFLYFHVSKCKV